MTLEKEDKVLMAQHIDEELRLRISIILQKPEGLKTKTEQGISGGYSLQRKLLYKQSTTICNAKKHAEEHCDNSA